MQKKQRNKRFFSLEKSQQKQLNRQFQPCFDELSHFYETDKWLGSVTHLWLSVFDHWLSREETHLIDDISDNQRFAYSKQLHSFMVELSDLFTCYLIRYKGRNTKRQPTYRQWVNRSVRVDALYPKYDKKGWIARQFEYELVIPELGVWCMTGDDYTFEFYLADDGVLSDLVLLSKKYKLHFLE